MPPVKIGLKSSSATILNVLIFCGNFFPVNIFCTPANVESSSSYRPLSAIREAIDPMKLISAFLQDEELCCQTVQDKPTENLQLFCRAVGPQ